MKIEEVDALEGEALDRAVAEIVTKRKPWISNIASNDGGESMVMSDDDGFDIHGWLAKQKAKGLLLDCEIVQWQHYPHYSGGRGRTDMMLAIAAANRGPQFARWLAHDINGKGLGPTTQRMLLNGVELWGILTASPAAYCRAAIKAMLESADGAER
jgi:hypothetical protein